MEDYIIKLEQEISTIILQYINLYQQGPVEIPVKELRDSVEELYQISQEFSDKCCSEVVDSVKFDLNRLENDVLSGNGNEIVDDLHRLYLTLRNYSQLINYMAFIINKNKEKEDLITLRFLNCYLNSEDPEKRMMAEYVKKRGKAELFNYEFADQYNADNIDVFYDGVNKHFYTIYNGKKMYLSSKYTNAQDAANYLVTLYVEQDKKSPHCYQKDEYVVQDGDVVIDAGVAEGNFALDVIDKVSKIYLVECEESWIEALRLTFAPYGDKVVFVNKFLDSMDDDSHITIDQMVQGNSVNYIKMDIEGAEIGALQGASQTLENNQNIKCNICSYHKMGDEQKIKDILSRHGFDVSTTEGYMFFKWDQDALIDMELRRGLTRGLKKR